MYRFTDIEVYEHAKIGILATNATNDYLKFTTIDEARRQLVRGVAELKTEGIKKQSSARKMPVQKQNHNASN